MRSDPPSSDIGRISPFTLSLFTIYHLPLTTLIQQPVGLLNNTHHKNTLNMSYILGLA